MVALRARVPGRAKAGHARADDEDAAGSPALADPPAERIALVEAQGGLGRDVGRARDPRQHAARLRGVEREAASNTLPVTLSCRHGSPGRSFPSACRQASFALVPVPHGERSYALPGHSTKLRLSSPGTGEGANSSTWSTSAPVRARHARRGERDLHLRGEGGEGVDLVEADGEAVVLDEEEPVAAPGHVSRHPAVPRHVDAHSAGYGMLHENVKRLGLEVAYVVSSA